MATFEQLKQQLSSGNWQERRDAIHALAQMTDQRDEVIPLLKELLRKDDDDDVIEACVEGLEQLGALDDEEVFNILRDRIDDDNALVRGTVVRYLTEFAPTHRKDIIPLLKERLRKDDDNNVIEACIEGLKQLGALDEEVTGILKMRLQRDGEFEVIEACIYGLVKMGVSINELAKLLSRNPKFWFWYWGWPWRSNIRAVFETVIRDRWWALPAEVRSSFEFSTEYWMHLHWQHCPECRWLFHKIFDHLQHGGRRQEIEWLLHRLAHHFGEPRWGFARHDFETLMGLQVRESAYYEEVNILRFRFLDAFATDRYGRPIREWIRKFQGDWDEILETEDRFDRLRDEVLELKRKLDEILREAERRREGRPLEPGERLPEDLQGQWNEISERLRRLEGDVEPGELDRARRTLEEATKRLLPQLREWGIRFRIIEVEGVLGEYNFYERKITLYPPMIELAAQDLGVAYDDLYTVVEMHETAHAVSHLGMDTEGRIWETPWQGTSELHELLAQLYTILLIRRLGNSRLEEVFLKLNKQQPERYLYWRMLENLPSEKTREFLVAKRNGKTYDPILSEAVEVVRQATPLIRTVLSETEADGYFTGLQTARKNLEKADTRWELAQALEALGTALEAHPFVLQILQRALPSGWPSEEDRKLLLADLLVEGAPVGRSHLRLTMDQVQNAMVVTLTQNQLIRRNTIVRQLQTLEEFLRQEAIASEKQPEKDLTQQQKQETTRKTGRTQP